MGDNSYESPKSDLAVTADRQMSLARGLAWAVPIGACGFCGPFAALGVVLLLQIAFTEMLPFDRAAELRRLPRNGIASAVVCSLVFAFAAFATFAPRRGIGFVRSLLVMGSLALLAVLLTGVATVTFSLGPRTYTSDPYTWLRVAIFAVVFLAGAVGVTSWQI